MNIELKKKKNFLFWLGLFYCLAMFLLALSQANDQMPIRAKSETYGYGVSFTMLLIVGTPFFLGYKAGKHENKS